MPFLRLWILLLVFSGSAHAAGPVAAPGAFDDFMQRVTGAGKQTVDFSKNGTPVAAPGVPQVNTDGGMPKVEQTGNVRNPSGNPVNVKVTGRIPPTQVAAAVGRALGKVLGPLAAGMAIWELCQELQFGCERAGSSGPITFTKKDPEICTVGPCYEYSIEGSEWFTSQTSACTAFIAGVNAAYTAGGNGYIANRTSSSPRCAWSVTHPNGGDYGSDSRSYATRVGTPAAPGTGDLPATQQEFLDAIASKSGWPSSSAISNVIGQSSTIGGEKLKPESVTISGPATSPGTTTTTNNTTNNTTKTETTTHNHNYEGDTITTTTTTVTNIINNTTGDTISNETKVETPAPRDDELQEPPLDTALPDQPKLYEPKYPTGLEGVWAQQKAALSATPLASVIGKVMPNVGSSGSCPVWNIDFSVAAWASFGVHNVAPPCQVWDWARLIILVSALLLARALIFGG